MTINLLAVGDVVGECGTAILARNLRRMRKEHDVHFCVVNGENAAGLGITPALAHDIFDAGADVITLGNHTWNKIQIAPFLDENRYILRPANYPGDVSGRGFGIFECLNGIQIGVMNLMGRTNLDYNLNCPFQTAQNLLKEYQAQCDIIVCDFHAEATSEKGALAWHLDGKISALWGTHTHVPTADLRTLPAGTGFLSDLGMTGAQDSILGITPDRSIRLFRGGLPQRFEAATGKGKINAALFSIDTHTKKCICATRCDFYEM